jgi:mono/diheme cytochrome c family protein
MLFLVASGATVAAPVTNVSRSERGKKLAARLCFNCHLVGNAERHQTNADVPSFKMAKAPVPSWDTACSLNILCRQFP